MKNTILSLIVLMGSFHVSQSEAFVQSTSPQYDCYLYDWAPGAKQATRSETQRIQVLKNRDKTSASKFVYPLNNAVTGNVSVDNTTDRFSFNLIDSTAFDTSTRAEPRQATFVLDALPRKFELALFSEDSAHEHMYSLNCVRVK